MCFTNFRFRFQRAAQNVEAGVSEVDPQFLAALPTNIQEEVLAQQRIEQQRQAAQANPEAPVDPGEFLQTLPGKISRLYFEFQIILFLAGFDKKMGSFFFNFNNFRFRPGEFPAFILNFRLSLLP